MANTINNGLARSIAYYPAAGTDIDDVGGNLTWNSTINALNLSGRLFLQRNANGADSSLMVTHSGSTTSPYYFRRTRGTIANQTKVQSGDVLTSFNSQGRTDSGFLTGAYISAVVNGTVSNTSMPTELVFGTHNGTSLATRAKLTKDGVLNVNQISNYSGSDLTIAPSGQIILGAPNKVKITGGSAGQVLTTDGNGNLSWSSVSGESVGIVALDRTSISQTTSTLANNGSENINVTAYKSYYLLQITTSHAAWVTVYSDNQSRTDDASRTETTDPLPGDGVIAEVITTGAQTIIMTPAIIGFNNENPATNVIPIRVKNKSGSSAAITVTLTLIPVEQAGSGSTVGLSSRTTKVAVASSVAANADANIDLSAFKGYVLYKMQVSSPAWVRIYNSSAARTADVSRSQSTDPLPSAGVLAEVVTSTNNETLSFSPALHCYNDDPSVNSTSYIRVRNLTGSTTNITVTLTLVQSEA